MVTVLQEVIGPEDLVISDSHDLATGFFEAHGLLEAVATDALLKMYDLDDNAVRGSQIIRVEGGADNLDCAMSTFFFSFFLSGGHYNGSPGVD